MGEAKLGLRVVIEWLRVRKVVRKWNLMVVVRPRPDLIFTSFYFPLELLMRAELIRTRKNLPLPPPLHTQYAHWLWADAREGSVLPLPRDSVPITGAGRDFSVNTLVSSSALTFYAPSFRVLYARSASLILVVSGMGRGTGGSLDPRQCRV